MKKKMVADIALHFRIQGVKIIYFHLYEDTLEVARAFGLAEVKTK